MKKNVLIVFRGLRIDLNDGAKKRLYSMIDSYKCYGYNIDVLIFCPLQNLKYFSLKKHCREDVNWIVLPNIPSFCNKLFYYISLFYSMLILAFVSRIKKYQIIQSETHGAFCKYVPSYSKLVLDFHGDVYDEYSYRNPGKRTMQEIMLRETCKSIEYANHIIVVSENLKIQLEKYYGKSIKKYSIVSCGVDLGMFKNSLDIIDKSPYKDRLVVGYIGGLQKWQCIHQILDIVISLKKKNDKVFFVLYTNFSLDISIKQKLDVLGRDSFLVKNLKFDDVPKNLPLLDGGFLFRENIPLNLVASPTKILEYLAAGVPLICNIYSGDYARAINHEENGFVITENPISESELNRLLSYLEKVKANRLNYGKICIFSVQDREFITEFGHFIKNVN